MEFNFQKNKTIFRNLLSIQGIGPQQASKLCDNLGISLQTKYSHLTQHKSEELNRALAFLRKKTSNNPIQHNLYKFNINAIHRLISINSYRGRRLKLGYPARGQRTRSNAKIAKHLKKSYSSIL